MFKYVDPRGLFNVKIKKLPDGTAQLMSGSVVLQGKIPSEYQVVKNRLEAYANAKGKSIYKNGTTVSCIFPELRIAEYVAFAGELVVPSYRYLIKN